MPQDVPVSHLKLLRLPFNPCTVLCYGTHKNIPITPSMYYLIFSDAIKKCSASLFLHQVYGVQKLSLSGLEGWIDSSKQ